MMDGLLVTIADVIVTLANGMAQVAGQIIDNKSVTTGIRWLAIWVTALYWAICVFLFRPKFPNKEFNVGDDYAKPLKYIIQYISDFQERICLGSPLRLFSLLFLFYLGLLWSASRNFNPTGMERSGGVIQAVALVWWIFANTMSDFLSLTMTRWIYRRLAQNALKPTRFDLESVWKDRRSESIISSFFVRVEERVLNHFILVSRGAVELLVTPLKMAMALIHLIATLPAWLADRLLTKQYALKVAIFVAFDIIFTLTMFFVNGLITNYCYLLLTKGATMKGGTEPLYNYYKELNVDGLNHDLENTIIEHGQIMFVENFNNMVSDYGSIITSHFDVAGGAFPGMALITFLTMATSVGPAAIVMTHFFRVFEAKFWMVVSRKNYDSWQHSTYMFYIATSIPIFIFSYSASGLSEALKEKAYALFIALLLMHLLNKWIENLNKAIQKRK